MRCLVAIPFFALLTTTVPEQARAESPICTNPATQDQVAVAPGDSSAVVVWRDNRFDPANPYDIFASRLNYHLNPVWSSPGDGADECNAAGSQIEPAVAIGSDGTAWMSWRDYRTCSAAGQILVQAIAPDGSPLCSTNGTTITTAGCDDGMRNHTIISTSPGSAIVIWHHKYDTGIGGETYDEIRAQKLSATGCARSWGSTGVVIKNHGFGSASGTSQLIPYAVSDGSGGVLVVWYYASRLYIRRVDSSGNVLWSGPVRVSATEVLQEKPSLAPDGSGGVIVAWQQGAAGARTILAQRIDANGALQWGSGGKVIVGSGGDLTNPQIVRSTLGRSFVIWEADYSASNSDIFAQRINLVGDTLASRIPICTASYAQTVPRASAGPSGSCYIVWQDGRNIATTGDDADVYAQTLDASGNVQCLADGWLFAAYPDPTGRQYDPRIASVEIGPGGHAFVVWSDSRNGNSDIYGEAISGNCVSLAVGPNGVDSRIGVTNWPNPFSHTTTIRFRLPERAYASLRIYDMSGRLVRRLATPMQLEAGDHELRWDGTSDAGSRVSPGIYFSRLATGATTETRHMVFLK